MSSAHSLVLITVDCLRADHVGFLGYKRPTTPFLDSLAAESMVLENALAAGAPTYYSFPAIMASRDPLGMGRNVIGLSPDEPTIATTLYQTGYATGAFIAGNPYLAKRFGYARGFDVFKDFLENAEDQNGEYYEKSNGRMRSRVNQLVRETSYKLGFRPVYDELHFRYSQKLAARTPKSLDQLRRFPSSDAIVSNAADWLRESGHGQFFLWLHFMDPHGPYYPPQEALNLMGRNEMTADRARYLNSLWNRAGMGEQRYANIREEILTLYDAGIRWADQQIASLVKILQDMKLWDRCVFALTADHGEEFLEHGGRMHAPPKVTEELVHVPLLIRVPGIATRKVTSPFSLLNLAPTLLESVGAQSPAGFQGRSYYKQLTDGQDWNDQVIVECISGCSNPFRKKDRQGARALAVREARYKLILDFGRGSDQLFDLQADPGELHPLPLDAAKPIRRRLLECARKHIAQASHSNTTNSELVLALRNLVMEPGAKA